MNRFQYILLLELEELANFYLQYKYSTFIIVIIPMRLSDANK